MKSLVDSTKSNVNLDLFDAWIKSPVWYLSKNGEWKKALVIDRKSVGNNSSTFSLVDDETGNDIVVTTPSIDKYDFEYQDVKRHDRNPELSFKTSDMTTLTCLNEPEVIECLRCRFLDNSIYTKVGPILIAVNPCKTLSIYNSKSIDKYCKEGFNTLSNTGSKDSGNTCELSPHVFQIGNAAYHNMFIDPLDLNKRENQVIIVHGESGAGKTVSVKFILDFLTVVSVQRAQLIINATKDFAELGPVDSSTNAKKRESRYTTEAVAFLGKKTGDQVVASNPIMESFGNAKTLRNNNSSRFGKFIELNYDSQGLISGAVIKSYLLETLRVTYQSTGERNFHIFYEVCTDDGCRERLFEGFREPTATPVSAPPMSPSSTASNSASKLKIKLAVRSDQTVPVLHSPGRKAEPTRLSFSPSPSAHSGLPVTPGASSASTAAPQSPSAMSPRMRTPNAPTPSSVAASLGSPNAVVSNVLELFRYTNQSGQYLRSDSDSDATNFSRLRDAMAICLIEPETQTAIFNIILSILHLGNISLLDTERIGGDHIEFSQKTLGHVQAACEFLGISKGSLLSSITKRHITVAGKVIEKRLSKQLSEFAIDALAQVVFHALFQWIIIKINSTLTVTDPSKTSEVGTRDSHSNDKENKENLHTPPATNQLPPPISVDQSSGSVSELDESAGMDSAQTRRPSHNASGSQNISFIGILDIFGFEYFENNSFEQLCINYTNEKLQNHFNFTIFETEKALYLTEGLNWTIVDYPDNSARLELLEHRMVGLFALCDEQLKLPLCSDEKLAKSFYEKCNSEFFFADKAQQKKLEFTIKHFARDVCYQTRGFLEKNRGNIAKEFLDCLATSSIDLVASLSTFDPWKETTAEAVTSPVHGILSDGFHTPEASPTASSPSTPAASVTPPASSSVPPAVGLVASRSMKIQQTPPRSLPGTSRPVSTNATRPNYASSASHKYAPTSAMFSPLKAYASTSALNHQNSLTNFITAKSSETARETPPPSTSYARGVHRSESSPVVSASASQTATGAKTNTNGVRRHTASISSIFSRQLNELMSKIQRTKPHFVRCIKPNNELVPNNFHQTTVMHQLRCGGTLAAIQVFRSGYSTRIRLEEFVRRFSCFRFLSKNNYTISQFDELLARARLTSSKYFWRAAMDQFFAVISTVVPIINRVESVNLPSHPDVSSGIMIGKSMVFLRQYVNEYLEAIRYYVGCIAAKTIQHYIRNHILRRKRKSSELRLRHKCPITDRTFLLAREKALVQCIYACIRLQRRIRVFLAQRDRYRSIGAASRIAAFRRACLVRREFVSLKRAAVRIQSLARCRSQRQSYRHTLYLVTRLQGRIRAWLVVARRRLEQRLVLLKRLIPVIQAHVRGKLVRARLRRAKEAELLREQEVLRAEEQVCVSSLATRLLSAPRDQGWMNGDNLYKTRKAEELARGKAAAADGGRDSMFIAPAKDDFVTKRKGGTRQHKTAQEEVNLSLVLESKDDTGLDSNRSSDVRSLGFRGGSKKGATEEISTPGCIACVRRLFSPYKRKGKEQRREG